MGRKQINIKDFLPIQTWTGEPENSEAKRRLNSVEPCRNHLPRSAALGTLPESSVLPTG